MTSRLVASSSLALALCACGPTPSPAPRAPSTPTAPGAAAEERFSGTLTEIRFGCAVDASCDLVVDGTKHVHFGHDTRLSGPVAWGDTESLWPLMERPDKGVGTRVEVFAAKVDATHYTLAGKEAYYVKVLAP